MPKQSFSFEYISASRPDSRCVYDVDYDEESQEMIVVFQQRGTYKYLDVPAEEFELFKNAGSMGQYFNENVRTKYSYERIG